MPSPATQPGPVTVVSYSESGGSAVQVVNFGATSGPVATSVPTTLPGGLPAGAFSPRFGAGFFPEMFGGGCSAGLGGCGTLGFGIAGVVLLIMTCTALFAASREARQNAELAAGPAARER